MDNKLYQQELLEHYKNSAFRGKIENPDIYSSEFNPSCGDKVEIFGLLNSSIILQLRFMGSGCVVSQAAASLLLEYSLGKDIEEVKRISKDDILRIIGIELGPNRLKCALLSLEALVEALNSVKKN